MFLIVESPWMNMLTVIKADLEDKEALRKVIKGAYGVYAVTDYWAILDDKREEQMGKNVADISKEEGVQHLIYSSLPDVKKSELEPSVANCDDTYLRFSSNERQIDQGLPFPVQGGG